VTRIRGLLGCLLSAGAVATFCLALLPGAGAAAAATHRAAAAPVTAGGTWGNAMKVAGLAALSKGGAVLVSVSCGSPGNCSAGGEYVDGAGHTQPFVVGQTHGRWGTALQVPGIAALNSGDAVINSVSCGSVGNCSAGGSYTDGARHSQAFVVNEVNGTWGTAQEIPGSGALNSAGAAEADSLSCGSAGNCAVVGTYSSHASRNAHCPVQTGCHLVFVADEANGTWGTAIQIPGTAALAPHGLAEIRTVSCASAGNCAAGGSSVEPTGHQHAWVASEAGGTWRKAMTVPGLAPLNQGGFATTGTISCSSVGFCSAGGRYTDRSFHDHAFVVSETDGHWGTASQVPGTAVLGSGGGAEMESVSCSSPGNCSAGGDYAHRRGPAGVYVVNEVNGVWDTAIKVPGIAKLNRGGNASISSLSCAPAGGCSAGGVYASLPNQNQAFVVTETNGTWGTAIEVPGSAALNNGDAQVSSVSCAAAGKCSAAGSYFTSSRLSDAFVVSES
jgi:hypothetical protein